MTKTHLTDNNQSSTQTPTGAARKPRSSTKPGGFLVHPNAAGKVGSVPTKPNPNGAKR
jgi:hypothetical protein